jgi:hypothetical protein
MDRLDVVFVGDADWSEFRHVHQWLGERAALTTAADLSAALPLIERDHFEPALIVFAQRWPGEFPDRRIERLRRAAPLARFSELLGSWCEQPPAESEPVLGTLSYYWHRWVSRMAPEFALQAGGELPIWNLSPTATDEERLLEVSQRPRPRNRGLLAIHSRDAETAAVLCDAAGSRGFAAVWRRGPSLSHIAGVRAGIWDATNNSQAAAHEMNQWRAALAGVPTVALLDFPRAEDRECFLEAGAAAIVSKPFWLDDVFWQIEQL